MWIKKILKQIYFKIMKKILIIGSNSFSGSHMVSYFLKEGYYVLGISRSSLDKLYLPF